MQQFSATVVLPEGKRSDIADITTGQIRETGSGLSHPSASDELCSMHTRVNLVSIMGNIISVTSKTEYLDSWRPLISVFIIGSFSLLELHVFPPETDFSGERNR